MSIKQNDVINILFYNRRNPQQKDICLQIVDLFDKAFKIHYIVIYFIYYYMTWVCFNLIF